MRWSAGLQGESPEFTSKKGSRKEEEKKSRRVGIERDKIKREILFLLSYYPTFLLRVKRGNEA